MPRHAQAARLRQTLAQVQTFAISRRMLSNEQGQCHHQNGSECASRWRGRRHRVAGSPSRRSEVQRVVGNNGWLERMSGNECWGVVGGRACAGQAGHPSCSELGVWVDILTTVIRREGPLAPSPGGAHSLDCPVLRADGGTTTYGHSANPTETARIREVP